MYQSRFGMSTIIRLSRYLRLIIGDTRDCNQIRGLSLLNLLFGGQAREMAQDTIATRLYRARNRGVRRAFPAATTRL